MSQRPDVDMVAMSIIDFHHDRGLPRDGHRADEDVLLDDLQRGARLQPARSPAPRAR